MILFYENDRRDIPSQHIRPMYIIAKVRDIGLKRAMLDEGSSPNIISLSALDAIGAPRESIMRLPTKVSSFGEDCTHTLGFVNVNLTVRLIRATHQFHVIDAQTSYHLLFGFLVDSSLYSSPFNISLMPKSHLQGKASTYQ